MEKCGTYSDKMTAIGYEKDGVIIAGTAFENFNKNNMFGHQRIDKSPSRQYWYEVANYIFNYCDCKRFTATIEQDNLKAICLNKKIGFEIEATLKDAGRNGDLLIMVLWRSKCHMLNWGRK